MFWCMYQNENLLSMLKKKILTVKKQCISEINKTSVEKLGA